MPSRMQLHGGPIPTWVSKEVVSGAGRRTRFLYEYDFGDSWQHEIVLEGIEPAEAETKYPRCTDGKRACPPEDVGGLWGYDEFLDALANPAHEEHEHYLDRSGGEFDPEELSLDAVNQELRRLRSQAIAAQSAR